MSLHTWKILKVKKTAKFLPISSVRCCNFVISSSPSKLYTCFPWLGCYGLYCHQYFLHCTMYFAGNLNLKTKKKHPPTVGRDRSKGYSIKSPTVNIVCTAANGNWREILGWVCNCLCGNKEPVYYICTRPRWTSHPLKGQCDDIIGFCFMNHLPLQAPDWRLRNPAQCAYWYQWYWWSHLT